MYILYLACCYVTQYTDTLKEKVGVVVLFLVSVLRQMEVAQNLALFF